jgi:predicted transcriptional regulator/nitrous oxidase accessory protein NosD
VVEVLGVGFRGWGFVLMALVLGTALLDLAPPASAPPGDGVDRVVIQRDPGANMTWVANGTYYISDTDVFWLVGYNDTTGWVGPVSGYWWVDNPASGDVQPRLNVSSTNFTAGPQPGVLRVNAYCQRDPSGRGCDSGGNTTTLFNSTGLLTVLRNPVIEVRIRDAPNGGGGVVLDATYFVGDTDAFWAAGYDANGSYAGDVSSNWTVGQPSPCTVSSPGTSTTFRALAPGTCRATATYDTGSGFVSNLTGILTILQRPTVYVDDDGACGGNVPCFPTFRGALANASDGYTVLVYAGTYPETLIVDKRVRILGLDRSGIRVDGGGSGTVFLVIADFVEISNLTIANAQYGVYVDRANRTTITHNVIQDYVYGLYFNETKEAFTAWNVITRGSYGVVTDHASNDAVRYNEISYNTVYGAKDFDSTLRNCFNWNVFHHNRVAYYYDPHIPITPFEFDGNLLEDNEVGVIVENGPALRLTNNVFRRNGRALEVIGSDLNVSANTFEQNGVAIRLVDSDGEITANALVGNAENMVCTRSAARIEGNVVTNGSTGVDCSEFSGTVASNTFAIDGLVAIALVRSGPAVVRDNVAVGRYYSLRETTISDLRVSDAIVLAYDSQLESVTLEGTAQVREHRSLTVRAVDEEGALIHGAAIEVRDRNGGLAAELVTGEGGLAPTRTILVRWRTVGADSTLSPFTVSASIGGMRGGAFVPLDEPGEVTVVLSVVVLPITPGVPVFPWSLVLFGSLVALSAATLLGIEPLKYAALALLLPLFTRIRKDNVLDDYTRGRVYQYLEMSPGDHFHGICRALSLGAGTVTYHLEVLSRLGLVLSRTDGVYKRFYPAGVRPPEANGGVLSEVQVRIVHAVRDLPGITQKELVALLGVRQSTLGYQMAKLIEKGLVRGERRGRNVRYHAAEKLG